MAKGGAELRRLRDAKGWSRQELAVRIDRHAAAVAQWENDVYTPRHANAAALDHELTANGAILRAFGYLTPSDEGDAVVELRHQLADLAHSVNGLTAEVQRLDAEVAALRRGGSQGAN